MNTSFLNHNFHLAGDSQQVVVLAEVGANLDRRREFVSGSALACLWIFAPGFLDWKSDRRNAETVRESSVVVTLELVDWIESLAASWLVREVRNQRRLFSDCSR